MNILKFVLIGFGFISFSLFAGNVVVVNSQNNSEVTTADIKKLYLGKKGAFSNGNKAELATLNSGNGVRETFNSSVLNKSESQYTAYWAKMAFTGRGVPPKEFTSPAEVKAFVGSKPNAIGIIDDSLADSTVKVVLNF